MKHTILLIEDEPDIQDLLKTRLEISDFNVITANDGIDGLEKVDAVRPSLILLDLGLPRMSGFTFVRELRNRTDETRRIPIIIVAAHIMPELFAPQDISAFIMKPYNFENILTEIEKILADRIQVESKYALIIDGNSDNGYPVEKVLRQDSFEVACARDSYFALEEIIKQKPRVIFISSKIGGMDLLEFCQLLKKMPNTKNIITVVYDHMNSKYPNSRGLPVDHVIVYGNRYELEDQVGAILKLLLKKK